MSDDRLLNLDSEDTIEVILGGKSFCLREQRRALLVRIVKAMQPDPDHKLDPEAPADKYVDFSGESFERALPTFALMLGIEPGDSNYKETITLIEENLTFSKASKLFNAWFRINGVSDFLGQAGNPLIPQETLDRMREEAAQEEGAPLTESASDG